MTAMEPEDKAGDEGEEQIEQAETPPAEPAEEEAERSSSAGLGDEEIVTEGGDAEARRPEEDDDIGEGMDWPH